MKGWQINLLIASALVAILLPSGATIYSAQVGSSNHHASCARSDLVLDAIHDVIVIAVTPKPGGKLTRAEFLAIQAFESKAFARIDQARC